MTTTESGDAAPHGGTERLRRVSSVQRLMGRPAAGAVIITVFVWLLFAVIALATGSRTFLTLDGTLGYLDVAAQVGIVATAVALLMIAGEYDLSIGSLVGFAGIAIGIGITEYGLPPWAAILAAMALTTMLGVVNGWIVVRTGLPSFIVTLATLFIIRGLTIVLTAEVTNITFIPISRAVVASDPIAWLFNWNSGNLKVSVFWWVLIAAIGAYVLMKTRFG
ncbi:MAG: ABC transporter permease, partial [Candidatus Limnocylindrales bacterium]